MSRRGGNRETLVPGAQSAIDQMKYEIASEFGVNLGAETVARANGSVGGEITKRLVATAQSQLSGQAGNIGGFVNRLRAFKVCSFFLTKEKTLSREGLFLFINMFL